MTDCSSSHTLVVTITTAVVYLLIPNKANAVWYDLDPSAGSTESLVHSLDSGVSVTIPYEFVLFSVRYPADTDIWVSSNGYISVDRAVKTFDKRQYPLTDSPGDDPVLIAAYKARIQYRPDEQTDAEASVTLTTDISSLVTGLREEIKRNTPTHTIISDKAQGLLVSWNSVSFFSGNPATEPYPRNSFQLLLLFDGDDMYAVFNYKSIAWDGGHVYGGDASTGVGADNPPAQAGFNIGGGAGFIPLPYGEKILDVDDIMVSGEKSHFIYRLSALSSTPVIQGCLPTSSSLHSLGLTPASGPMFGGNTVTVSGVCFKPDDTIKCVFGNQESVQGEYVTDNTAVCFAPSFYSEGRLLFTLTINGEAISTTIQTYYTVALAVPNPIALHNISSWRSMNKNEKLSFSWNPSDVYGQSSTALTVKLFTYMETSSEFGWTEEITIADGIENSGSYSFLPSDLPGCDSNCSTKTIGAVVLETPDAKNVGARLWSDKTSLGWYVTNSLSQEESRGDLWPDIHCYDWFLEEKGYNQSYMAWLNDLEPCPCTLTQAISDVGRFVPDPGCSIYNPPDYPNNCYYHSLAVHCVRSRWPSSSSRTDNVSAGGQCCYANSGELIYAADSIYGSTVDKAHVSGAVPYDMPGHVPSLSHWVLDVITYHYCCLWNSNNDTCTIYMDQRPTRDCADYKSVKIGSVFGGGIHVMSLEGQTHSSQPDGLYSILHSSNSEDSLQVQGFFTTIAKTISGAAVSVLTSVAVRDSHGSEVIEIHANPASNLYCASITVNGESLLFIDPHLSKQQYKGILISSYSESSPPSLHSNFTISLKNSGIGLQITCVSESLSVILTLPSPTQVVGGLLLNSDISQSLLSADTDSIFSKTPSPSAILSVQPDSSLEPSICSTNSLCLSDYRNMGLQHLARSTRAVQEWVQQLKSISKPVTSCGLPVYHGKTNSSQYTSGSIVTVTGCRYGYSLQSKSDQTYTCLDTGMWNPAINASCQYDGFPELGSWMELKQTTPANIVPTDGLSLPITITVIVVLLIPVIVGSLLYLKNRRKQRQRAADREESDPYNSEDGDVTDAHYSSQTYMLSSNGSMVTKRPVSQPEPHYQPPTIQLSTGYDGDDQEFHSPAPRANTYRVAVDPTPDQMREDHSNVSPYYYDLERPSRSQSSGINEHSQAPTNYYQTNASLLH